MKKILSLILLTVSLSAMAQTPPLPSPSNIISGGSFLESAKTYFSEFDTNSTTFVGKKFDLWTGADYASGVNVTSSLGIEYNVYGSFSIESVTRNAGIAGIIASEQLGGGYNLVFYDSKFTAYVSGGYDFAGSKPYAAVGLRAKKALTRNTFAGIGLEQRISGSHQAAPIVGIFAGFTL